MLYYFVICTKIRELQCDNLIVEELRIFLFRIASFAINRPAFLRLEGNFALLSALCAGGFVHLAWPKISSWTAFIKISHVSFSNIEIKNG
jgi:hypothetical protein